LSRARKAIFALGKRGGSETRNSSIEGLNPIFTAFCLPAIAGWEYNRAMRKKRTEEAFRLVHRPYCIQRQGEEGYVTNDVSSLLFGALMLLHEALNILRFSFWNQWR